MIHRDAPVILQPAAGLEQYHNFYDPKDLSDYRRILAGGNLRGGKLPDNVSEEPLDLNGIRATKLTMDQGDHSKLLLHFHGGGFIGGVPGTNQQAFVEIQQLAKMDFIGLDYGLAPEHPFPEGLMDCVNGFLAILDLGYRPEDIVFIGESAGGTLCLTVSMYLRDNHLPMPGALVLLSPNIHVLDPKELRRAYEAGPKNLKDLEFIQMYEVYLRDQDNTDPLVSPKFGDFTGLPPMLIQCGSSEQMSPILNLTEHAMDCTALAVKANVDVTLHVYKYMFHVFQFNVDILPEATEAIQEVADFLKKVFYSDNSAV